MARWDVVVVGAGLAGAVAARRFREAGLRVVLVERGRALSDPPGQHLRNQAPARDDPDGWFAAIDPLFDYVDVAAAPAALPGAFTTTVDGGLGLVWTNNCPRARAGVDRPDLLDDGAWSRCYAAAEHLLGVRDDEFDDSERARFVADRLTGHLAAQGRALEPLALAGRRTSATHVHYVGPAEVLAPVPGVRRHRGEVDRVVIEEGRARGVRGGGDALEADLVVVAAGAVETPGLLWRSGVEHPALGRHLSFHPVLLGQVVLDRPVGPGPEPDPLPRLAVPPTPEWPWLTMVLRDTNPFEPAADDRDVSPDRLLEIQVFAPVDPDPDNRVVFDARGRPAFTVPLRPDDERRRAAIRADVDQLCARLGRWRRGCEAQWAPLGTPHLMGTCRAGVDPATSVLHPDGRVRGVEGLLVVGNAAIPSRLAVNPTLTAAALAVHAVDEHTGASA